MAVVGTIYTIDPCVRTPQEVAESLLRSPADDPLPSDRQVPQHKRLRASLSHERDNQVVGHGGYLWLVEAGSDPAQPKG